MLAGASAQEDNVRADAREAAPTAKTANSEKPAAGDRAQSDVAAEESQTGTVPARTQTAQAEAMPAGEDAKAVSDPEETIIDAANDNVQDGAPADVAAALPQTAQPAPAPQQPTPMPVLTLAAQQVEQGETQPAQEGEAPKADIAPVIGNAPAKATPQLPEAQNAQKNGQNAPAPDAGGKPPAPGLTTAKDAATEAKIASGAGDFGKALQETQAATQDTQPTPAAGETARPAETATAAPRPAPDTNSIALATPAAPGHQPLTQGAEKLAMTAQSSPQEAPQAAPNVNQMAVEVAARSEAGAKQFEIRLDPPELGRVEVRLSIDAHGKAEAHLTADQPQTLELLQKDAPILARALRDAGLNVAQDALNFSLKNQQQQAGGDDAPRQGARGNFHNSRPLAEQPESGAYTSRGLGLLDIKV